VSNPRYLNQMPTYDVAGRRGIPGSTATGDPLCPGLGIPFQLALEPFLSPKNAQYIHPHLRTSTSKMLKLSDYLDERATLLDGSSATSLMGSPNFRSAATTPGPGAAFKTSAAFKAGAYTRSLLSST